MNARLPPTPPGIVTGEISALISRLHETSQRLEELTAGQIDTVSDAEGRTFVLRRAQEDLRQSEASRQAAILNALPAHVALLDAEGTVVSVNEGWRRFAEENGLQGPPYGIGLNYLTICDRASGDDATSAQQAAETIRAVLAGGGQSTTIEYPCHSPAEKRWFLMTVTSLPGVLGGGAVVMHVDITQRVLGEEALRRNEEEFRAMFELASVGIVQADPVTSRLLRVNKKICKITGYSADEMLGMRISELTHPEDREEDSETFQRALLPRSPDYKMEKRFVRKDGSIVWVNVNVTVIRGAAQEAVRIVAAVEDITERRRSEQAAERALQRLTDAQRIGQIGDWEYDMATQAIDWSPQMFEILGRDSSLGPPGLQEHFRAYDTESSALLWQTISLAIASGEPQECDFVARRQDGTTVHAHAVGVPRKDHSGAVTGLYGTLQDISERKRSEGALAESEFRFRQMAQNINDMFFLQSFDFSTMQYVSPAYERIWGRTCASLYANPASWAAAFHPDDLHIAIEQFEARGNQPFDYEFRIIRPDGEVRWIHVKGFPIPGSAGEPYLTAGIGSDITDRKAGEDALRRSEAEFRTLAESMPQMVWITRPDGWNVYFSQQWVDYTGLSLEETLGQGWTKPFHPDDQLRAWDAWRDATTSVGTYSIECRLRRADGVYRWWLIRGVPVKDAAGTVLKWFGTCTDIHDLKMAELEIARSNRVYAVLSGINTLIVRVRHPDELFQEACSIAVDAGGFRMSLIAVADPQTQTIVPMASAGNYEGLLSAVAEILGNPETAPKTMIARAMRQGKTAVVSNDCAKDPRLLLSKQYVDSQVRSIAILPLLIADEAVGVLALYSSEAEFFQAQEMKLLTELANDIAFCMGAIRSRDHKDLADQALRASLKEKEALLKEVHHRVKNNMQVITSLLRLESNRIDHPTTKGVLKDMQNRILAMASLHEALYRSNSFAQVDLASYLKELTTQLQRSLVASPGQIAFHLDLLPVGLDLDQAVPCGLIVNELVSNALKHGFPDGRRGTVRVEAAWVSEGLLRLRICDDGIGLSPDFAELRVKSLGLQLVADLARQLGGSLVIGPGPGAVFEVTFRPGRQDDRPPG